MTEKLSLPVVPREAVSLVSTLCKFVVTGFRSKKEYLSAEVILCSQRKAGRFLKNRPSGSYILRLAKDALVARKATPLFISVKFDTTIVHQQLSLELQGVSQGDDGLVVRVDSKAFKSVGRILDFLPKVQVFAKQAAANKNFVDQTLSETEVAQELQFKEYVVFPNMGTIVIHRKTKLDDEDCTVARVGIEWEKCSLYSAIQNVMSDIGDFNDFLLGFLRVGTVDRYEVMGALGYNPNDLDIAANRGSGKKLRASPERTAFNKTTSRSETSRSPRLTDADYNEKSKLMAQLRYHYSQKDGLIPEPPLTLLRAIYRAISLIPPDNAEAKMEWVDGGLFADLAKVVCVHGGQLNEPKEPVKICKRLVASNPEGCLMLCRLLLTHLREHVDCVSMYLFVQQIMSVPAFELVFLQNRGAHFLIDFYEKTCVILHGRQYDRSLDFSTSADKGMEEVADSGSEKAKDIFSSTNSDELEQHLPRTSNMHLVPSSAQKDGPSTNSETGDDESSASVGQPAAPSAPAHTPRTEKRELEKAIEALEKQRNALGDAKVGPAIASVQLKLQAVTLAIKRADEINALKMAIEKLDGQRGPLSDDVVDLALRPLKDQLAKVEAEGQESQNAAAVAAVSTDAASSTSTSNSGDSSSQSSSDVEEAPAQRPQLVLPLRRMSSKPLSSSASLPMLDVSLVGRSPESAAPKTPAGIPGLSLSSKLPTVSAGAAVESPSPESPWVSSRRIATGRGVESGSYLKRGGSATAAGQTDTAESEPASVLQGDHKESAVVRLSNLAVKLGETFMASDLTALLQLKKQTAPVRVADNKALQARVELEEQKPLNKNILEFRNSKGYIIKMLILNILAMVSSKPHAENYFDPPVNLVLTELVAARKNRFLVDDEEYRMRLFHVLAPYANKVEAAHRLHWRDAADVLHSGGSGLINYRMKLDLFLFRMRSQLTCVKACTTIAHYRAIQALCGFLVDYVKNCYTRVAVPCVIDTCMEALLEIAKNLFDPEIDFSTINAEKLRAIIHLLDVFDSLGFRSTMGSTTELLVNLFVDSEVFWLFVRRFMGEFFLNNSVYTSLKDEKRSGVGRELIKQVRLRLVSHFRACVALVKRHYETTKRGFAQSMGVDNSLLIRLLLTKFEFLVIPGSGAIPRFFDTHRSPYDQYHIKIEMLRLLIDLFGFPESPLVTRSLKYVDFYISDSYLSFIKLFNSNDFDDATLQMCRLYMEVLIQFSKIKQQSVRMKISQLRIMDFLANQIDLEYQMTLLTDESASQAPEKYSSLSAVTEDIAMRRSPRPQRDSTKIASSNVPPTKVPSPDKLTISIGTNRKVSPGGSVDKKEPAEGKKETDAVDKEEEKDSGSSSSSSDSSSSSNSSDESGSSSARSNDGESAPAATPMGVTRIPRNVVASSPATPVVAAPVAARKLPAVSLPKLQQQGETDGTSLEASAPIAAAGESAPKTPKSPHSSSGSSSSGFNSSDDSSESSEGEKKKPAAAPMGVTRIPRVVKVPPTKATPVAAPKVSLGPKAAVAIPLAQPKVKPAVASGFTLRFGEGNVQEWDTEETQAKVGSVTNSSRVAIDLSSSGTSAGENSSSHSSSSEDAEDEKDVQPVVSKSIPMGVMRIPRTGVVPIKTPSPSVSTPSVSTISVPLLSASPRKPGLGMNLRLPPNITKDGSSHGSAESSPAATPSLPPAPFGSVPSLSLSASVTKDRNSSSPLIGKATPQLSARYDQQPGMGVRPQTHFSTIKMRPTAKEGGVVVGNLASLFGEGGGSSSSSGAGGGGGSGGATLYSRDSMTVSLDSAVQDIVDLEQSGSGSLTARELLGETRVLAGERSKIKSFTRLFAAPLWGEKEDPIRSKLVAARWAKVKVKDVLALLLKEKDASVASLPGTKSLANPMALKSLQVEGGESSSSDETLPPKSPSRMRSPLSPKPPSSSPRLERFKEVMGRSHAVVPALSVPTKDEQQQYVDRDKKSRMASGERLRQESGLSALQNELRNTDGPNRIGILVAGAKNKEKQQKKKVDAASLFVRSDEYEKRRGDSKLYASAELHVSILTLLLDLMTTDIGTLDPLYVSQFPVTDKKLNIPFYLRLHLNHPSNRGVIPFLTSRLRDLGTPQFRLLKLLVTQLFQRSFYKDLEQIAKGAYGVVYRSRVEKDRTVAVKLMGLPNTVFDRCVLHDIFTEVSLLDMYRTDTRACHLYDYGVDDENYWLVMKFYLCSLRAWRKRQTRSLKENLPLYLNVFMCVLNTMQFLPDHNTNHYDLKCDNFLLQPLHKSTPEEEIYNQPTSTPNFTVALADFGEAKIYPPGPENEALQYTFRNRGTEYIKSPEMLMAAYSNRKDAATFDRRARKGANSASDIWSLGCLFFELLTGEFLFYDDDWVKFFLRVTQGTEVLTADKQAMLDNNPDLIRFFNFILQRKQQYRPSIQDVIQRFLNLRSTLTSKTPRYVPIPPKITVTSTSQRALEIVSSNSPKLTGSATSSPVYQPGSDDVYTPEEQAYFMANPTEILPRIFISSLYVASNRDLVKSKLEITHMVNASGAVDPFPGEFEYLNLDIQDHALQSISPVLQRFIEFVRRALEQERGCVLIFSARGVSRCAALAIAWVMEDLNQSFYESFIFVKDRRYVINPNHGFVRQLVKWGARKATEEMAFQCHCGACVYSAVSDDTPSGKLPALESGSKTMVVSGNILACHCSEGDESMCPMKGCQAHLEQAQAKLSFVADTIRWTFVLPSSAQVHDLQFVTKQVPKGRPGWKMFQCRTCEIVTHATFADVEGKVAHLALMCNIPVVSHHKTPKNKSASVQLNPQFKLSAPPIKAGPRRSFDNKKPPIELVTPLSILKQK